MKGTGNISNRSSEVWLFSKAQDLLLLGLPVWLCWVICFSLPFSILNQEIPLWVWVVIVIGIDVSHVWSTIFRTYLDRDELKNHHRILKIAPIVGFSLCFVVAIFSVSLFWTLLAYLALYHFMKQQYGFMQLYKAKYGRVSYKKRISDQFIIYWSMLYPVVFWHLNYDRNFDWFVAGDFINLDFEVYHNALQIINQIGTVIFFSLLAFWLIEEIWICLKNNLKIPTGKWLWILTTAFNWYFGIVYFNSDLVFTMTNVVAHGIPYFVLMLVYVGRKNKISKGNQLSGSTLKYGLLIITTVLILSFGEEYLWDMLLYDENHIFFENLLEYPFRLLQSPFAQALALALLSLPQVTHYILDGYIWKSNDKNPYLKPTLFH